MGQPNCDYIDLINDKLLPSIHTYMVKRLNILFRGTLRSNYVDPTDDPMLTLT